MAIINGTKKGETINGTAAADSIFGDNGNDRINGGAGNDHIDGGNGSDLLSGGAGDDVIDGGNGQDTLVLAGNRADYHFYQGLNGAIVVRDRRPGGQDGSDRLFSIERVEFADGTFKLVDLITAANAAPVAADDALTVAEDAGATDVTAQLLANDGDADGDAIAVTGVQAVSDKGAAVTVSADGKVMYDPGDLFAGLMEGETATDSFTYTITDAAGQSATATATVTITGVGQEAPEPDAYFYVAEDATTANMLAKMSSWLGFQITGAEGGKNTLGTVAYEAGSLTFTADHDASDHLNHDQKQTTTFTVTGADGQKATIMAIIEGNNDAIVAVDDAVAVGAGGTTANLWSQLIGNDQDVDSFLFEIDAVGTAGTQGQVAFDAVNRVLTYSAAGLDLAEGETITDSFTYVVDDGWGATDTATVTVTVTGGPGGGMALAMKPADPGAEPPAASAFLGGGRPEGLGDGGFADIGHTQTLPILGADVMIV